MYEKFYSKWTPILVNNHYYVINIVPYYNRYLIGLISADNLIRPLRQINLGANGYVSLVDENEQPLTSPISNSGKLITENGDSLIFCNRVQQSTVHSQTPPSAPKWSLNMAYSKKS